MSTLPRLARTWIADRDLSPHRLVEGRALRSEDEVVITRVAAKSGHLKVGAVTTVQTPEPVRVTVVGIATFGSADGFGQTTFTAFTPAGAARHITKNPASITRIVATARPGVSQATLAGRVQAAMPPGTEAITGARLTQENIDHINAGFLGILRIFLLIFAGVALVVGTFSIYNSFSILVAQRTRDAALLRALGATRRQILGSVLGETVAVGVFASLAGLLGGLGLAGLLKGLFDSFGFSLPASGLVFTPASMATAFSIGVVTTLVAGLAPALRASRVAPLAALRDVAVDRSGASRARFVGGVVVAAAGAAAVIGGGGIGGQSGFRRLRWGLTTAGV